MIIFILILLKFDIFIKKLNNKNSFIKVSNLNNIKIIFILLLKTIIVYKKTI